MTAIRGLALTVRFVLELGAIAAVGSWGFTLDASSLVRVIAGLGAPMAVIALWGAVVSPRARFIVPGQVRLAAEAVVWLAATATLLAVDASRLAMVFAVLVVADVAALHATADRTSRLESAGE